MADESFAQVAREATKGVQGDLELRLEAQAEILARLEAAAEQCTAKDISPEDRNAQAITSLGDLKILASELTDRYHPRIRRRRWAHYLLLVCIPLALISSLLLFYGGITTTHVISFNRVILTSPIDLWHISLEALSPSFQTKKTPLSLRALWQANPDNIILLGHYASRLHDCSHIKEFPDALQAMQKYRQLDQGNAQPYYLQANWELSEALEEIEDYSNSPTNWSGSTSPRKIVPVKPLSFPLDPFANSCSAKLWVKDRAKLDHAMNILREGMKKTDLRNYDNENYHPDLGDLPTPNRFDTYAARRSYWPSESSSVDMYKSLLKRSAFYARLLVHEGRSTDALPYLNFWRVLCRKVAHGATGIGELYGLKHIAYTGAESAAIVYREMKREDSAKQALAEAKQYADACDALCLWGKIEFPHDSLYLDGGKLIQDSLAPLAYTSPVIFTHEELTPTRNLGYILHEEFFLAICLFAAAMLMLGSCIWQFIWTLGGFAKNNPPLRLLIPLKVWAAMMCFGVLLPIGAYYIFTRWSTLAWRDISVDALEGYFVIEMSVVLLAILLIPRLIAVRWLRKRCWDLRFPYLLSTYRVVYKKGSLSSRPSFAYFAQYRATLMRSLLPVMAVTTLLTIAIAVPYLVSQEIYWLQRDTVLVPKGLSTISPAHQRAFAVVKSRMEEVADKLAP